MYSMKFKEITGVCPQQQQNNTWRYKEIPKRRKTPIE